MATEKALFRDELMKLMNAEIDEWISAKEQEVQMLTDRFVREEEEHCGLHRDYDVVENEKDLAYRNLWRKHRSEAKEVKRKLLSRFEALCEHWGPLIERAASRKSYGPLRVRGRPWL